MFGPDRGLVGILTQPDSDASAPGAPGQVILNPGILHRVGASRLHVQIARAWAERGITSLRFDFSGIGDSEVRRDSIPVDQRFVVETREALDYMQDVTGVDRFVIGGLCSGADGAYWTALEDERVVGVWQIDSFCYRTRRYFVKRYAPKLIDPRAWLASIKGRIASATRQESSEIFVAPEYRRRFPPRETVGEGLAALLERGVELFFFFSGAQADHYNYAEQHAEAFPELELGSKAWICYEEAASHTLTGLPHQRALVDQLTDWVGRWLPDPAPAAVG